MEKIETFEEFLNSKECKISNHSYSQIDIGDVEDAWNARQKEIDALREQIEKMKNCFNCKDSEGFGGCKKQLTTVNLKCWQWKLKE